ncbi:uncharacterized protein [Bombus fervidus]|uniref:uncharacterized protein n=1 Tax=Bombus fervidus TaxID=203811 RepID=UPI003AB68CF4
MFFLLSRRIPGSYTMLALIATNLVISMAAPLSKRLPEDAPNDARNGFSAVPKILEIQLPLKIATKDDLVAWARYVMGLMASRINITLTTVKESQSKPTANVKAAESNRGFDNSKAFESVRPQNSGRNLAVQNFDNINPVNGIRHYANTKSTENTRYAENFEKTKIPAAVRILENGRHTENIRIVENGGYPGNVRLVENGRQPENVRVLENRRQPENVRGPQRNGNLQLSKDKVYATAQLPSFTINGATTKSLFNNNRQLQPPFNSFAITDTTVPSPLEIAANINIPRSKFKEPTNKNAFDTTNLLKSTDRQLFVPQFPDFGPAIGIDVRPTDIVRNTNVVSPPARTYLPVTMTSDNIKFPNDPFVTRYFFDGVERNVSSNLGIADEITFTTRSPLVFNDEIPLKGVDFLSQQRNISSVKPLFKVPFEAVITFTHEEPVQTTTLKSESGKYFTIPTRDPLDQFPPYFDTNYTVTNESGQINVVFDDSIEVNETMNNSKKEERKKQEKKKEGAKRDKSKKQKSEGKRQSSPISQLLKTIVAIRRNNTPSTNLTPPPLNQQTSSTTQRVPVRQRVPQSQRTQLYPTQKPPSALKQKGRRNQTSLAQQVEVQDNGSNEDDDNKEDDGGKEGNKSKENSGEDKDGIESDEENDNKSDSKESSNQSESDEDYDDDEEGGPIKTVIDLLMLVAPALEDLSDPDSDADIADLLEVGIPILQDLSEGDGEAGGSDIPALLLPILLQLSGGKNGERDSAAILTPLLQLVAPLIGPIIGPLAVPLSRQISNAPGQGGSSFGDLIKASLGPLLEPVGPGKMTVLSNLIAGVVSSLSKNSGAGGKSDLMSLVKAVVAGSIAGTSAGSSGSNGAKDTYGAPTSYGADHGPPRPYGYPKPSSNSLDLLGSSIKDIFNAILKVVASLVNAIATILGASSNTSNEPVSTTYGPAPPPKYGTPSSTSVPFSETISITTSKPQRLIRL